MWGTWVTSATTTASTSSSGVAAPSGRSDAQEVILDALKRAGGSLDLHDKSSPEAIQDALGISKKSFKRAAGGLYRAKRIVIHDRGIDLVVDDT